MKLAKIFAGAVASTVVGIAAAQAATVTLNPTADGSVQTFGGISVITDGETVTATQSGGLVRNAIFEFNLGAIPDNAVINSITFTLTQSRFVSQLGPTATYDVFAYLGDGVVDVNDYDASGDLVIDETVASGGTNGDQITFSLADLTMAQDALLGNMLTLRLETDSFASIQVWASEAPNANYRPELLVDYTVTPNAVPLPAAFPLMAFGIAGLGAMRARKKTSA